MSTHTEWRTSSFSAPNNDCVEVAISSESTRFRDSKSPDAGILTFNTINAFLTMVKSVSG